MIDYVKFKQPIYLDGELVFNTDQSYAVLAEDKDNIYVQDVRGIKKGKYNWVSQISKSNNHLYRFV